MPPTNRNDDVAFSPIQPGAVEVDGSSGGDARSPGGPGGNPAPEPGTLLLLGSGLAALGFYKRSRRKQDPATGA